MRLTRLLGTDKVGSRGSRGRRYSFTEFFQTSIGALVILTGLGFFGCGVTLPPPRGDSPQASPYAPTQPQQTVFDPAIAVYGPDLGVAQARSLGYQAGVDVARVGERRDPSYGTASIYRSQANRGPNSTGYAVRDAAFLEGFYAGYDTAHGPHHRHGGGCCCGR